MGFGRRDGGAPPSHPTALLLSLLVAVASAQKSDGDPCITRDGLGGECRAVSKCQWAIELIKQHQVPEICSFRGDTAIVCCAGRQSATPRPSHNHNHNHNRPFGETSSGGGSRPRPPFRPDGPSWEKPSRPDEPSWEKPSRPDEHPWDKPTSRPDSPSWERPDTASWETPDTPSWEHPDSPSWEKPSRPETPHWEKPTPRPEVPSWEKPTPRPEVPSWEKPTPRPLRPSGGSSGGSRGGIAKQMWSPPWRLLRCAECREYTAAVTQTIEALPLVPNPKPVTVSVPNCDISRLPLIVGGENTEAGEFPHMAAIGFSSGGSGGIAWNCGGSLISDQFVLTAAHCTVTSMGPPVRVRLGELNLYSDEDGAEPWDVDVAEVVRHPDYKPPAKYNDIALLRLAERARVSKFVRPACIFTEDDFPVNKTVATGWGRIDYAEEPSETLLKVALDIIGNRQCNELWRSASGTKQLADGIVPSMMCAGVLKGGKDTCQGDSGGPIQITSRENKCVYQVIGVTSFGKFCAAKNSPGVYTRVASYVPWIESVVWPRERV